MYMILNDILGCNVIDSKLENPNRELKVNVVFYTAVKLDWGDSKLENPNRELKVTETAKYFGKRIKEDSKLENPNRELKANSFVSSKTAWLIDSKLENPNRELKVHFFHGVLIAFVHSIQN